MTTTVIPDAESPSDDDTGRLRTKVCDKLAARKGAVGVDEQAKLFELHRSTLYRIRKGERIASLPVAFRMARRLGTKVEKLFIDEVA